MLCATVGTARAQDAAASAPPQIGPSPYPAQIAFPAGKVPYPPYSVVRYDEDYSYLRDPAKRTEALDRLKYLPLSADGAVYLSFGGQARERFEVYDRYTGLQQGVDQSGYFLQRYLAHADLHLGGHVRVFGEVISAWESGADPKPVVPFQKVGLDANQLFVDLSIDAGQRVTLTARLGRQEVQLGAGRLVAPREGPNVRRPFDGARLIADLAGATLSAFYLRPIQLKPDPGVFDEASSPREVFYGAYGTVPLRLTGALPHEAIDAYVFARRNDQARYGGLAGRDNRQVFGLRAYGSSPTWQYDVEANVQRGHFADQPIRAWAASGLVGRLFAPHGPLPVGVGLGVDIASGDKRPGGRLGTYDPLFPRAQYFTEAAFLGPTNLTVVHPGLNFHVKQNVSLTGESLFIWRTERGDGAYSAGNVPVMGPVPNGGRWLGAQADAGLTWQFGRHIRLVGHYAHLFASDTARAGGLPSANFGLVELFATF